MKTTMNGGIARKSFVSVASSPCSGLHPPGQKKKPRSHAATRLRSTNVESVRS